MCSVMRVKRCGSSGERSPTRCVDSARGAWRPRVRMWTTSMLMQPASAAASAPTGDGPSTPALSSVKDAVWIVAENLSAPSHVRSAIVGGLLTLEHRPTRERRLQQQPRDRQNDEQVRQHVTERAVRAPRLRARVDDLAPRQIVLLGHLVEALDQQLDDEDEEEDGGALEEQCQINPSRVP